MFDDLFRAVGAVVGTVCGIAVAPIAIALDVSESAVRAAISAGCRTQREIRDWIEENE
jgi:hypothetical protein